PARPVRPLPQVDHRHRRLRRNAAHLAPQVLVEHHVAKHQDPPAAQGAQEAEQRGLAHCPPPSGEMASPVKFAGSRLLFRYENSPRWGAWAVPRHRTWVGVSSWSSATRSASLWYSTKITDVCRSRCRSDLRMGNSQPSVSILSTSTASMPSSRSIAGAFR